MHGDRYSYDKTIYYGVKEKLNIYCSVCDEYFWQRPDQHLSGRGCLECGLKSMGEKGRKPIDQFICESNTKHGENYVYCTEGYGKVLEKIKIKHVKCGSVFIQSPYEHLRMTNPCPRCNKQTRTGGSKINKHLFTQKWQEKFLKEAIKIHGEKYDYSKIIDIYSSKKIEILCKLCQKSFLQTKYSHLEGNGCPTCANERKGNWRVVPFSEFLERSRNKFGERFRYIVEEEPFRMGNKIKIIDTKCNTTFYQIADVHLIHKESCPTCLSERRSKNNKLNPPKQILQINPITNEVLNRFSGSRNVKNTLGFNSRSIREACQYEKERYGFKWKYV